MFENGIEFAGEIPFTKCSVDQLKGTVKLTAELPVRLILTFAEAETLLRNLEKGVATPFKGAARFGTVFDRKQLSDAERKKLLKILSGAVPHTEN